MQGLFAMFNLIMASAVAQAPVEKRPISLPEIKYNLDFELNNIFQGPLDKQNPANRDQAHGEQAFLQPLQLVGTLIMGKNKLAWVKTNEYQILELRNGQHVPGSSFRIAQIFTDSVELVNTDNCVKDMPCKPTIVLDLN